MLAALGARTRDKYPQTDARACSVRGCNQWGAYGVSSLPALCLLHLVDRVGLARDVLFGDNPA